MKRFLTFFFPILFCTGIITVYNVADSMTVVQQEASVSDHILDPFSDDLLMSQRTILEQSSRDDGDNSPGIIEGLSALEVTLHKVNQCYPFSTIRKQAICYGLLFLQYLF